MYQDGKCYFCTHWYWDEAENEYELCGTWKFEKNYPDMPDYWHLQELGLGFFLPVQECWEFYFWHKPQ